MRTYLAVFNDQQTAGAAAGKLKAQGVDPNQMTIANGRPAGQTEWPDEVTTWQEKGYTVLLAQAMEYLEPQVQKTLAGEKPVHMQVLAGLVGDEEWMDDMRYVPTPYTSDLYDKRLTAVDQGLDYDDRRSEYYAHYNQTYAPAGVPYSRYDEAYRFGALLAEDVRYQDRRWEDITFQVKERWTRDHPAGGAWEDVEEAIQYAWGN